MAAESYQAMPSPVNMFAMLTGLLKRGVAFIPNDGAPTDGTSGTGVGSAGKGSMLFDYTNGQAYLNTGTITSPTWTKIPDAVGDISLARGFMLRGGATGLAEAFDANDSGKILVGDGTDVASVAVSGDATLSSAGAVTIGAVVNGARVATVANVNTIGGSVVMFRITAAALTGNVDVVMAQKVRVIDAYCINTAAGGAGDTITINNGATAITDAMDCNKADKVITRAGTIDDASYEIAAAGTLRVVGASAVTCEVVVTAIVVA